MLDDGAQLLLGPHLFEQGNGAVEPLLEGLLVFVKALESFGEDSGVWVAGGFLQVGEGLLHFGGGNVAHEFADVVELVEQLFAARAFVLHGIDGFLQFSRQLFYSAGALGFGRKR